MRVYNQFFEQELFLEIYEFAKKSSYRRVNDTIYAFKSNHVQGSLQVRIEKAFKEHNILGTVDILRVQRIDTSIKVIDDYHRHNQIYRENLVCFLNEDFIGGEFEYKDENINIIQPLSNTSLVFGPDLEHKILPVTEGIRYTLVAFLTENPYINKQGKTLI